MKNLSQNILQVISLTFILGIMVHCSDKSIVGKEPVDYVNPYIGNISHLLVPTYPTIHLPNSMLRVYPERDDYTGNKIKGLPVIVTSHRGNSAFAISPVTGDKQLSPVIPLEYDNEVIKPYYYQVFLNEDNINVEYAPSHQSAIYRFKFSEGTPSLIINSKNGVLRAEGNSVSGYQQIGDFSTRVYLFLETEVIPEQIDSLMNEEGRSSCIVMRFKESSESMLLRYGISFISEEQAKKNLYREVKDIGFDEVKERGRALWNETLGKISIEGDCEDSKTLFYTSLYRTYERMICISEDGMYYSSFDDKVHGDNGIPFYTDDWIWDTYRATHPLRVIIEPEKEVHMINSFIRMAEQMDNFWMPTFPEITGDSRRMNSNHGVATVIDAYVKGLTGFNLELAYDACKKGITEKTLIPWSGDKAGILDEFYKKNGYFPALKYGEKESVENVNDYEKRQPVAVTLGTVYDEWCLSQIAKHIGKKDDYSYFLKRSLNYHKLFNPDTKFFHPKDMNGNYVEPFDYRYSGGQGARDYYGENNGWVYRWDVPHNIADLISLMGGDDAFVDELENMYDTPLGKSKFEFYAQIPDHTGNVGQFSMANEPSLHIPYLYNYAGQAWRTQKRIRTLLGQWFRNDLMGVPGDEDGGGMTAFVVFSQLGFYPITPGLPIYVIGSPMFEKASLKLGEGKTFDIVCHNYSPKNKYIQSAKLNGLDWNKSWFTHQDLMKGGKLEFVMGEKPNKQWASDKSSVPPSFEMNGD
ncbi:putative alpha-1,2-mannosidase [Dysgonomonas sp. PFB1-18]|uniref:GH92 family glycosyl hydrolase n=1 Tax=unclassified Dysgonomonas TaxID=2630389 RepID=UPI0024734114|nr:MULTISPECIES: GH92 family glycosyl hydrolase [unclassified Dysgonomonas]MDH6308671.1 putative alpha-1,2-mannosidase [Dysgonomonas sp. PF1-14]MDH6338632.1 putative alpha-1,2-mannosidase [Dysgonomonas sp. PF1-16]MDH6379920.1 putative alpha-1,2-mannosidase [Dysgonomonas sp. PFB1-18]MDH6397460.1 putative alpha-1,2-mannosidase [Dysgonomonas sp. PF1-23]